MITILLQKILDLLEAHFPGVITLLSKLNLIEEDTEEMRANVDSMKTTLEDVDAQATAAAGSLNQINTTATSINGNVAAIKNNSEAIKNNVMSMSTNIGNISAYSQATANNTLDIDEKITSIASDTTDIRTSNNDIALENSKIYDAIKWLLSDKDISEDASGMNSVSFDTDYADPLEALTVGIIATQSGSGDPSPDNVRPISGYSNMTLVVNGQNVVIALGQTVYGGILDVVSGILKITYAKANITSSNASTYGGLSSNGVRFTSALNASYRFANAICNMAQIAKNTLYTPGVMAVGIDNNQIYWFSIIDILGLSDLQAFKDWLDLHPVDVIYELATPLEVQLTPEQITTLKGLNTISTDTNGEINVTYKESIKNYLDKRD